MWRDVATSVARAAATAGAGDAARRAAAVFTGVALFP